MTVFESLMLMVAFATLVVVIITAKDKK
ncbi:putative holin-like toxin [Halalkalibacter alkalisediminis]|uniref:Holin-like toxin n=1 Tax=Halalkalibacter alkalisediminis TaxID=935616 RepID=A0ABV6NJ06_9BACI